jgi:hypothetical protein
MPDWTWHPIAGPVMRFLPPRQARRMVVATAATLGRAGGLVQWFGQLKPPPILRRELFGAGLASPVFVAAGVDPIGKALTGLAQLGVGAVEIRTAVGAADLAAIARPALPADVQLWLRIRPFDWPAVCAARPSVDGHVRALVVETDGPAAVPLADIRRAFGGPVLQFRRADQSVDPDGWDGVVLEGTTEQLRNRLLDEETRPGVVLCTATDGTPADLAELVALGADAVGITGATLIREGPALAARINAALYAASRPPPGPPYVAQLGLRDRLFQAWPAAMVLAVGLALGGIGAAIITIGPVLLGYDEDFLHLDLAQLRAIDPRLVGFLQHDRITLAGTMVSIGILYAALATGMRRGIGWARLGLAASGVVGFGSLLLFLAFGYFDPLHAGLSCLLLPFFAVALRAPMGPLQAEAIADPDDRRRRRALVGQLLMVVLAVGLLIGGTVIAVVGCRGVFVASDLDFLRTTPAALKAADPHLLSFIAHDRAGFGGALMSDALALLALALWGWRPGFSWVFWSVLWSGVVGFGSTIAIHLTVDYTDVGHLAPVAVGGVLFATSLALSAPYLLARTPT